MWRVRRSPVSHRFLAENVLQQKGWLDTVALGWSLLVPPPRVQKIYNKKNIIKKKFFACLYHVEKCRIIPWQSHAGTARRRWRPSNYACLMTSLQSAWTVANYQSTWSLDDRKGCLKESSMWWATMDKLEVDMACISIFCADEELLNVSRRIKQVGERFDHWRKAWSMNYDTKMGTVRFEVAL